MGIKVGEVFENDGVTHHGWITGDCPGCKMAHLFDNRWTYNGNAEAPTFRNSMLAKWDWGPNKEKRQCHSYVTDGNIEFLEDCTHELKGKTVSLPDYN